jgi:cobalt-zinc-cadmium efflux system outer membrane protein
LRYFPDADDVAGIVEVSWPLTLLDDNRDAIRAAQLRITGAHAQRQHAHTEAGRLLARAYARARASAFALRAIDRQALPAAKAAYDASLDSYQAGVIDYLAVLDAERTLLETRNQRLDAMLGYHRGVIELERLTAHAIQP